MDVSEIIVRCRNGDQEAWNMIVNEYSRRIYNMALNFAGNADDASDITQDIFLKIYNNIGKYNEDRSFHSWVLTISKNHCIDYYRKNKRNMMRQELDENTSVSDHTPEDSTIRDADISALREKMAHLDPDLRIMLIMRDIQDYSYQDIAENLKIPLGTVKSRINRGRVKLARLFLNDGD
jgi:RNA polymerase sigma-70 factor (ECF subfamily)